MMARAREVMILQEYQYKKGAVSGILLSACITRKAKGLNSKWDE